MASFTIAEPRVLFTHIPKAAGQSLMAAFKTQYPENFLFKCAHFNKKITTPAHSFASYDLARLGKKTWDNIFTFSTVRNPWDRMVSIWAFSRSNFNVFKSFYVDGKNYDLYEKEKQKKFKEWLLTYNQPSIFTGAIGDNFILMPQSLWFEVNQKPIVNQIFKVEEMDKLHQYFLDNYSIDLNIGMINKSERTHYSHYYDVETCDFVYHSHSIDINNFNYDF